MLQILLLFLVFSSFAGAAVNWKDVRAITDLGKEIKNSDPLKVVDSVTKLIGMVPKLGPFAVLTSSIINIFVESDIDELGRALQDHLSKIDVELKNIENLIKDTTVKQSFKDHQEKVSNLVKYYDRFFNGPTEITKKEFVRECKTNRMLGFMNYIKDELSSDDNLALRHLMLREYDMKVFTSWSQKLITVSSQAVVLHTICLATEYAKSNNLSRTVKDEQKSIGNIFVNLKSSIQTGINNIKKDFVDQANYEINNFINGNLDWTHQAFSNQVYQALKTKYFWRSWLVVSYSGGAKGFHQHCVGGGRYLRSVFRTNRSVFIGSSNNLINLEGQIRSCVNQYASKERWYPGYTPLNIYNDMSNCLGALNGLGVIRYGNDAFGYFDNGGFVNVEMSWTGYSILAIAPELNDNLYDGLAVNSFNNSISMQSNDNNINAEIFF